MLERDYFIGNRKRLAEKMKEGNIAVLFSGSEVRKSRDVFYPFFANRDFFYFVGINEPEAFLVIIKDFAGEVKEYYFNEERDAETERWFGKCLDKDEIETATGLNLYDHSSRFYNWFVRQVQDNSYNVYLDVHYYDDKHDIDYTRMLSKQIREDIPWVQLHDLHAIISQLRTIKDDREIKEMEAGIEISRKAFIRMMEEARVGMTEYQLKALWDYEVAMEGVRDMSFQPIITTGANNFCIHYSDYTSTIANGDIILCDTGVNWNGVCCDISRAWPVDDWFTSKQELFYKCMLDCADELFKYTKPGRRMIDIYRNQIHIMRRKIAEYGLAKDEKDANRLTWHGGAHHIGFDNHDEVYIRNHAEQLIEKNMVFAVDIGIYDLDSNIGFRIEDDCLVTEDGCRNLTRCIPRELDELKEIMRLRR